MDVSWWLPVAFAAAGALCGFAAFRTSYMLLGWWGVPDAWAAHRSATKGDRVARLTLSASPHVGDERQGLRWEAVHVPLRSPTIVITHHLLCWTVLTVIIRTLDSEMLSIFSGATAWAAFIFGSLCSIFVSNAKFLALRRAARVRYESNFSKSFEKRLSLAAFNAPDILEPLMELRQFIHSAPGGARHLELNFMRYLLEELGDAYLRGKPATILAERLRDALVQAKMDLQALIFLDDCLEDLCEFLAEEGICSDVVHADPFWTYLGAVRAGDANARLSLLFLEPGVQYVEKARARIEQIAKRATELRSGQLAL